MQTSQWGSLKTAFGWIAETVQCGQAGAQILYRKLPFGKSIGYIPKGPVGTNWNDVWEEIDLVSKKHQAIFLKIEPDLWEPSDPQHFFPRGMDIIPSNPIQPRRTILVSLAGSEDDWMKRMKQKTRYNIRLAEKKDIKIHLSSNLEMFHDLMLITGKRDKFGVHNKQYYQRAFEIFNKIGNCALLEARYLDRVLGGLMVFSHNHRAWYFYGASSDFERNRMPTYLLQWEAMRWAASKGCTEYDLWGVPDFDESELEQGFQKNAQDLWGVYRFKRGFGGEVVRSVGAYDRIYNPAFYRVYSLYLRYFRNASAS